MRQAKTISESARNEKLRVLIAGGGTGGHVMPALAVARELVAEGNAEVRFLGTARGLETRLVPAAGFRLELIRVGQLNSVSLATKVRTLAGLPLGVLAAWRLLREYRPHVVLGVGGYASGPAMLAAILSGTPRMVLEPNAVPGMVNRWVGGWVQAAAVNFAPTARYFRNAMVTGIPVRAEFFGTTQAGGTARPAGGIARPAGEGLVSEQGNLELHLLIFGGSQGARVLNRTMPEIAAALLAAVPGLTLLHQCGARQLAATQAAYEKSGAKSDRWQVREFLEDMPQRFAAASLVLCRSGASTVAELAAAGKPSLLVPFPQAADDHQRRNAEVLVTAGAAEMLVEAELTPERLLQELTALLQDHERLVAMGNRARALAYPNAAHEIAAMLRRIAGKID